MQYYCYYFRLHDYLKKILKYEALRFSCFNMRYEIKYLFYFFKLILSIYYFMRFSKILMMIVLLYTFYFIEYLRQIIYLFLFKEIFKYKIYE